MPLKLSDLGLYMVAVIDVVMVSPQIDVTLLSQQVAEGQGVPHVLLGLARDMNELDVDQRL